MHTLELRGLNAFGQIVQGNVDRNLGMLRDIEATLRVLEDDIERFRLMNLGADQYIEGLRHGALPPGRDDADTAGLFEQARDKVGALYNVVSQKHLCAANSPLLRDEDGVVESYSRLLFEVTELYNKLNTMTWLVREIEADQDEVMPGSYSNTEALFAAMGV